MDWLEVVLFQEYVSHGWVLCPIGPGTKGPRTKGWNVRENGITDVEAASALRGGGLCHAYSGTASFDIDDLEKTIAAVPAVADYFLDPTMVRIDSGRPNRAKFLFALPEPLPSKTFHNGAFELRCGTGTGRTAQDVLPPTVHPDTGKPYKWVGDWRQLPPLPAELRALWLGVLPADSKSEKPQVSSNLTELEYLVMKRDPSMNYDDWVKVGMIIHHETGGSEAGLTLWDNWSSQSETEYRGLPDLRKHWQSFGKSDNPATADSLRRTDVARPEEFAVLAPEPVQPNPFRFLDCDEFLARPEPEWLIPDILPQRGLGCFWGQPGSGKTFLAIDTAIEVATGGAWRDIPVKLPGKVIYIAAEDDAGVQIRCRSALSSRTRGKAAIRFLPMSPVFSSSEQSKLLLEAIGEEGPSPLVFVDTLAAVTPGTDENSSKDMGPIIDFCRKIQGVTGGLVVLIHHSRKDGDSIRGSSSLNAAFDVEWKVTNEKTHRELYISKMRNGEAFKSYAFNLALVGIENGKWTSCVVEWA